MPFYLHLLAALLHCKIKLFILRTITAVSLGVPIFRVFTVLQLNYFEQKKINVGLEKKYSLCQILRGMAGIGWQNCLINSSRHRCQSFYYSFKTYRRIACNFLFLLKEAGDGCIGGVGEQA